MSLCGRDLGFYYNRKEWVLSDFSIEIVPGEVVGLVGDSGCGKTTIAKILAGYEQPMTGSVLLDGEPTNKPGISPVQMIFQHPERAVNPRWTLERSVNEGWKVDGEMLELFGIHDEWLSRYPNELSGGELQRFCIARALSSSTRYLIADEMTTMLDAITQVQIWDAVLKIVNERSLGILVVSHEKSLIDQLCDRTIFV